MDTQTITLIVLVSNMVVNCFLAYLYRYRVKIEEKQTRIQEENAEARRCLKMFRKHIKLEREEILKMQDTVEFEDFLTELEHLGEED